MADSNEKRMENYEKRIVDHEKRIGDWEKTRDFHPDHIIRLHEKAMNDMGRRIEMVEKKIDQIPWILCAALFNILLTLFIIFSKYFGPIGG